jgi:hypothetical protein
VNKATTEALGTANNQGRPVQPLPSRMDFVAFVRTLADQCRRRPEEWENRDLPSYLEAMAAWVEDMDGYYQNRGEAVPDQPTWKTLKDILQAARVYE